jgi:hypothetical protein
MFIKAIKEKFFGGPSAFGQRDKGRFMLEFRKQS